MSTQWKSCQTEGKKVYGPTSPLLIGQKKGERSRENIEGSKVATGWGTEADMIIYDCSLNSWVVSGGEVLGDRDNKKGWG